ncbi:hypothetical protein MGSAQ_001926 [marine sediment metagenome]|uniref:Uncharacterized protein n=1 Tax=marine sediment metagenome TaxID=412755 RepID=A0A1B6NTC6_9ZZZZ
MELCICLVVYRWTGTILWLALPLRSTSGNDGNTG